MWGIDFPDILPLDQLQDDPEVFPLMGILPEDPLPLNQNIAVGQSQCILPG